MRSTSSGEPRTAVSARTDVRAGLERYYTRYYRDVLGIPTWRDLVDVRLADDAHEGRRLARLEHAIGRSVLGLRLLNVGCGTGGFNTAAERAGCDAWGVDASIDAVAIATQRCRPGRAIRAVGESLPFRSWSFDVVYCYSTLEHVADPAGVVREMVRALRPDGQLYLYTPSPWSCFEGHYKVFWVPGLPRPAGRAYLALRGRPTAFLDTVRPLTLTRCVRLLEHAGARVTHVLDGDADRPVGGPLWPLVRRYYRWCRVCPYVELVAMRPGDS